MSYLGFIMTRWYLLRTTCKQYSVFWLCSQLFCSIYVKSRHVLFPDNLIIIISLDLCKVVRVWKYHKSTVQSFLRKFYLIFFFILTNTLFYLKKKISSVRSALDNFNLVSNYFFIYELYSFHSLQNWLIFVFWTCRVILVIFHWFWVEW